MFKKTHVALSALILALFSGQPIASEDQAAIQFSFKDNREGIRRTVKDHQQQTLNFKITSRGKTVQERSVKQIKTDQRTETILETNQNWPSRLQTDFKKALRTQKIGQKTNRTKAPVSGNQYRIHHTPENLVLQGKNEENVTEEERSILSDLYGFVGRPGNIPSFFQNKTVTRGETLNPPKEFLMSHFKPKFVKAVDSLKMTLRETKEINGIRCGVFNTEIDMKIQKTLRTVRSSIHMEAHIDLEGTIFLGIRNTWIMKSDLSGNGRINGHVKGKGKQFERTMNVSGDGALSFQRTISSITPPSSE